MCAVFFYRLIIYVFPLDIQFSGGTHLIGLIPPGAVFPTSCDVVCLCSVNEDER